MTMNLSTDDIELFYKLYWRLLAYANRSLRCLRRLDRWEEVRGQPKDQLADLRDKMFSKPDLLERFLEENPQHFTAEELAIVRSWRYRVSKKLHIMRYLKKYAVFMDWEEPGHLYGVLGLHDPIDAVAGGMPVPVWVKTTLLPFRGQIIYDGLISIYGIHFGPGYRTSLNETYNRLKESEGIIEQLASPSGEPGIHTHLTGKTPRKPAPDWRPAIEQIVSQTEKMRSADTRLQDAALGLLRASAGLTQAAFQAGEVEAEAQAASRLRSVHTALRKLDRLLYSG